MTEIRLQLSDRMDTLTDTVKKIPVFVTWASVDPIAISEWIKEQSLLLAQQLAISFPGITVRRFVAG